MAQDPIADTSPECALTVEDARLLLHELRAPMTAIVGYSGMLRRTVSDEDRAHILDGLERAVARMDAMLEAASLGTFKPRSRLTVIEKVDLCELAGEAATDLLASSAVEISVRCSGPAHVSGDPLLLRRALDNLLANAVLYGGGSAVEISVEAHEQTIAIAVSDRGPGVPEADRERVLLPLERLDRDVDTPGTGLGLNVVASVAQAHGGRVRVLAREGAGTTVRIELPAER